MKFIQITSRDVLRQLKSDLIGKDSYRGFTLTYSWLANQFGHFSLGFVPTLMVWSYLKHQYTEPVAAFRAAIIVAGIWFLFELYNFLGPLLLKKSSKTKLVYSPKKEQYTFHPAWGNIAFDTFTDVCFFCFGAFSASLFLAWSATVLIILIVLALILIYPVSFWFLTKMYLQIAQYPFQFRLSQWNSTISDADKTLVTSFLDHDGAGKHLLIFGPKGSGKTSMSVGIATEFSIKHNACSYTTAMKLYCQFFETGDATELWTWRNCTLLVIDDINPGAPVNEDLVTPAQFLKFLDTLTRNDGNRELIKNKNIVWVMGNKSDAKSADSWEKMLEGIGIDQQDILSVSLSF